MAEIKKHWYKEMAVYQIWPRSFYDGNGDGNAHELGDFAVEAGQCA